MRGYLLTGLLAAALVPQAAMAQSTASPDMPSDNGVSLRGFRIEGNVGADRFKAEGASRTKLGYGGTVGFDGQIGRHIVIGPEASYWRADKGSQDCAAISGGTLCQTSYSELGAAVRAGFLISPGFLIFGKGGYVHNVQQNSFLATSGLYYYNGNIVGPGFARTDRYRTDGYQVGGGVEFSLTKMVYISGQYVYSKYQDHTSRQRAMFGAGLRFK